MFSATQTYLKSKLYSARNKKYKNRNKLLGFLVRKRTIPTERLPWAVKLVPTFCGEKVVTTTEPYDR
jgi:hypothetical protein